MWQTMDTAPLDGSTIWLKCGDVEELGAYDPVEGGFHTAGELWPVELDPEGWRPVEPIPLGWLVAVVLVLVVGLCFLV